jgi:hypothetical protein
MGETIVMITPIKARINMLNKILLELVLNVVYFVNCIKELSTIYLMSRTTNERRNETNQLFDPLLRRLKKKHATETSATAILKK